MQTIFDSLFPDDTPLSTIIPLFGGAEKAVEEMSLDEFEVAAKQVYAKVREAAFSRGLPVIVERNGKTIKEFADGRTELVS